MPDTLRVISTYLAVFWVTPSPHRAAQSIVTTSFLHVYTGGCGCQCLLWQKGRVSHLLCISRQVLYKQCKPGKAAEEQLTPLLFPIFDAVFQGVKKWEDGAALTNRLFYLSCKLCCAGELTVSLLFWWSITLLDQAAFEEITVRFGHPTEDEWFGHPTEDA